MKVEKADFAVVFVTDYPRADTQRLRALIRGVRDDRAAGKPARHFRDLFRELKRVVDERNQAETG